MLSQFFISPHTHQPQSRPSPSEALCAAAGALLLAVGALHITTGLSLGGPEAKSALLLLFLALAALSVVLMAMKSGVDGARLFALFPIGLAFFLRVLCLDYQSLDYQDFLAQWAAVFRENGGFAAVKLPIGNYNAPYLYFMAIISYFPIPDLYLIKFFSILFDVLLAWGGCRLAAVLCARESAAPVAAGCALLLLPTVILNGALWGQCDSLYGALVVHALASALNHRPKSSVVLLAVAFSFKLQTIFLIPLWCALWFSGRIKFTHLFLFPLTYLGTILPALLLGKPLLDTLGVYVGQMGVNNELTFNAASIFSLRPYGTEVNESLLAGLGIFAAFLLVLVLLGGLFLCRKALTSQTLMAAAVVMSIGVPFLLPHMHDRYFFLADVLTVIWACANLRRLPLAALVELSSLSAYFTYLRMRFTCPIRLGGALFTMGLEALMVLLALVSGVGLLLRDLRLEITRPHSP